MSPLNERQFKYRPTPRIAQLFLNHFLSVQPISTFNRFSKEEQLKRSQDAVNLYRMQRDAGRDNPFGSTELPEALRKRHE